VASSSSSSYCREVVSIIGKFVEVTSDDVEEGNDLVKKRCLTLQHLLCCLKEYLLSEGKRQAMIT
jgi:hypothetical protein